MKTLSRRGLGRFRAGKFLVLSALLLPVLLGTMALSVDYSVQAAAQAQLRTAADAAALAGAMKLTGDARLAYSTNLATQMTAARAQAATVATANPVLGATPVVLDNASNSTSGDVVIGYVDPSQPGTALTTGVSATLYNAVSVTLARDESHGGIIPSFFAGALGQGSPAVRAQATAMVAHYSVSGFRSTSGRNANILPIALDVNTYNSMINTNGRDATTTTDSYAYNSDTGAISTAADGVYESKLYPVSTGSPGNWGTVKIGVSNNSTSVLSDQIQYGVTPAQLATYPGGILQINPQTGTLTLGGNPGISAGIKSALEAIKGRPVFVPIYSSVQGNGNNTTYTITSFAGVRVMAVNFQGSPKYVVVQPATVTDMTAIVGSPKVGWTSGGLLRIGLSQ
jgi:Flp pilus assembly protein TadG